MRYFADPENTNLILIDFGRVIVKSFAQADSIKAKHTHEGMKIKKAYNVMAFVNIYLNLLIPFFSIVFFFSLWFFISYFILDDKVFLPSPLKVLAKFFSMLTSLDTYSYILVTLYEAILGSICGAFIGLIFAFFVHKNFIFDKAIHPFISISQSIPAIAVAPILVLWVGYGTLSIVILCTLMVFFPIFIATLHGFQTIDKDLLHCATLDGASGKKLFFCVEFPLILPAFISGLRNGFTLSITGAIVGEMVMGGNGLGTLLTIYRNNLDIVGMFSTIFILCFLSFTIYWLLILFEKNNSTIKDVKP